MKMFFNAFLLATLVTNIQGAAITTIVTGVTDPRGIVVDGSRLIFNSNTDIATVSTSGGAVATLYSGATSANSLTVIGNNLFWIDANSGPFTDTQILTASKAGGGAVTAIY